MLKEILWNEVKDCLGREPSQSEFKEFVNYIEDYLTDTKERWLASVALAIIDYRNDNYKKCEDCGTYYKPDSDNWNKEANGWICRDCQDVSDPDFQNDLWRE